MRIHIAQTDIAWEDRAANLARADELLRLSPPEPGSLVAFPEMFDTGFSRDAARTADHAGESRRWLRDAALSHAAYTLGGVTIPPSPSSGNLARNRAVLHSPLGELSAEYDKVHPFSISGEDRAFSGGERVRVVPIGGDGALICPLICYDLRFPELFRAGRMLGAEVFVVIANWPAPRIEHWRALSIARAIENQAFVIAVNRVGADPMTTYPGRSLVVGPKGDVLLETGGETGLFAAEIAVSEARAWRVKFPIWRDSRPGLLPRLDADGRFDGRSMGEKPRS